MQSATIFSVVDSDLLMVIDSELASWMAESRQVGISRLKVLVSCSGANYPTIWVSLFMVGFFAAGRAFPCETTIPRRESRAEKSTAAPGAPKPISVDGTADGSAEGRWRIFKNIV